MIELLGLEGMWASVGQFVLIILLLAVTIGVLVFVIRLLLDVYERFANSDVMVQFGQSPAGEFIHDRLDAMRTYVDDEDDEIVNFVADQVMRIRILRKFNLLTREEAEQAVIRANQRVIDLVQDAVDGQVG